MKGDIDLAVHSLKDLPTQTPKGLVIGAVTKREDPRDVLVTSQQQLVTRVKRIGTSSQRRKAQLLVKWPDVQVVDIRGNLDTRLKKLAAGEFDAIVLARAGLVRLKIAGKGLSIRPLRIVDMIPAPGQGALAIEIREGDTKIRKIAQVLEDKDTRAETTAERSLLEALGGGCQIPVGAYAKRTGKKIILQAIVASIDGKRVLRSKISGNADFPARLGQKLAKKLLEQGAGQILSEKR